MMLFIQGCGKNDSPTPPNPDPDPDPVSPFPVLTLTGACSSGRLVAENSGGVLQLTFTSTDEWTIDVPSTASQWLSLDQTSGIAGDAVVEVTLQPNNSYDEYNASLTISSVSDKKTVVVVLKQTDALLLSSSKVEIEDTGGDFEITVKANVDVRYEVPAQYQSWLHVVEGSDSRGLAESVYRFHADANNNDGQREAVITFYGGAFAEDVHVYQYGMKAIVLSEQTKYIGPDGGRIAVEIRSNIEFSYSVDEGSEWLHHDDSRAMSSHTVYFRADSYDGTEDDRTARVTFSSDDGTISAELTVVQRCKGAIVIGETSLEVDCSGGVYDIYYVANRHMTVSTPPWMYISPLSSRSRAMENYGFCINVSPNVSSSTRSGSVIIYDSVDPELKDSVVVTQKAVEYTVTTSLSEGDFFDARSHEFTIDVNTTVDYEIIGTKMVSHVEGNRYRIAANHTNTSGASYIGIRIAGQPVKSVMVNYTTPIIPEIDNPEQSVGGGACEIMVTIECNTDIDFHIPPTCSWVSLKKAYTASQGKAFDSWTFSVDANPDDSARNVTIGFSAGDFWQGEVLLTQARREIQPGEPVTVNNSSGGSLEESIGPDYMNVSDLAVSGDINGMDVITLRAMATQGNLTVLDMSGTHLKKDLDNVYFSDLIYQGVIEEDDMVGYKMFYKTNLRQVNLPSNLKALGMCAFEESGIESIDIPDGVTDLGYYCFRNCRKLTSARVPGSVESIPDLCFLCNTSLSKVELSEGLRKIGYYAFAGGSSGSPTGLLSEIHLPSTVEVLEKGCFACTKLRSIVVPASVKKIEPLAFSYCYNLESIEFQCQMDTLTSHMLYSCKGLKQIVFPKGLKVIGVSAMENVGIDRLVIPEGVTCIMRSSLTNCGLKGLTLPSTLEEIGPGAIFNHTQETTFTIPVSVRKIGKAAFGGYCYFKELHMKCPVPPEYDTSLFTDALFNYKNCTLYVPTGSADSYRADPYWLKFKEIVEE